MVGSWSFNEDKCIWTDTCQPEISDPTFFTSLFDPRQFSFRHEDNEVTFSGPFKSDGDNNVTFSGPDGERLNATTITTIEIASDDGNKVLFVLNEDSSIRTEVYDPQGNLAIFDFSEETFGDLVQLALPNLKYSASFLFETKLSNIKGRALTSLQETSPRDLKRHYFQAPRPDTISANLPHATANIFIKRCEGERFDPESIEVAGLKLDRIPDNEDAASILEAFDNPDYSHAMAPLFVKKGHYQARIALDDDIDGPFSFLKRQKFIETVKGEICSEVERELDRLCLVNKCESGQTRRSYFQENRKPRKKGKTSSAFVLQIYLIPILLHRSLFD